MTAHLIVGLCIRAALNTTQSEVVSRHRIADTQWEFSFQQCILRTPVYHILYIYLVCKGTFIKMEILTDIGVAITLGDA